MFTTKKLLTATAVMATAGYASGAAVLGGTSNWNDTASTFDASGFAKLVVIVTGEHGFGGNNDGIFLNDVLYDGLSMTPIIQYEGQPEVNNASPDQQHHHMYYLDNPATSTGAITFDGNLSRYTVTAFGLNGTAPGFVQAAQKNGALVPDANSIDMTVSAESIVIAGMGRGGDGNTYGGSTTNAPLTERSDRGHRNWSGHVTGTHEVATSGTYTYSFAGNSSPVVNTIVAEFAVVPTPSAFAAGLGGLVMLAARRRRRSA